MSILPFLCGLLLVSNTSFAESINFAHPRLGLIAEQPAASSARIHSFAKLQMAQVDWRPWATPVKDQGLCAACVAFATIGAAEIVWNIAGGEHAPQFDLSEQDIWNQIGACHEGAIITHALARLTSQGTADEACFPYTAGALGDDISDEQRCADAVIRRIRIAGWDTLSDFWDVHDEVTHGPVVTSMSVYEDFLYYKHGIYKHTFGKYLGEHSVVIVGFNDAERVWIVRNSWGKTWGEDGYFRISYNNRVGLGESGTTLRVKRAPHLWRLHPAQDNIVVRGNLTLASIPLTTAASTPSEWSLRNSLGQTVVTGQWDRRTLSAATLLDGTYTLSLVSATQEAPSWHSRLFVANQQQLKAVRLMPRFDTTDGKAPIVKFVVEIDHGPVPPTEVNVVLKSNDGSKSETIAIPFPGSRTVVSWHSWALGIGAWTAQADAHLGKAEVVHSEPVDFILQSTTPQN